MCVIMTHISFLQLCQNILENSLKLLHLSNEICRLKFYNNTVGSRTYISRLYFLGGIFMRYDIQIAKVKDENSNLLGYADVTLGGFICD